MLGYRNLSVYMKHRNFGTYYVEYVLKHFSERNDGGGVNRRLKRYQIKSRDRAHLPRAPLHHRIVLNLDPSIVCAERSDEFARSDLENPVAWRSNTPAWSFVTIMINTQPVSQMSKDRRATFGLRLHVRGWTAVFFGQINRNRTNTYAKQK